MSGGIPERYSGQTVQLRALDPLAVRARRRGEGFQRDHAAWHLVARQPRLTVLGQALGLADDERHGVPFVLDHGGRLHTDEGLDEGLDLTWVHEEATQSQGVAAA